MRMNRLQARPSRPLLLASAVVPAILLAGCGGGGGGGGVASTPAPAPAPAAAPPPAPTPPPAPVVNYDTAEYRRSNAAAQAQALTAYNAGATGSGIVVGVVDSGVDATSAEFAGRISPASNDFAGSRGIQDGAGHGTAVSSVLLGGKNDSGTHGVALGATLFVGRTDSPGSCAASVTSPGGCSHNDNAIAAALDAAVAARARVVNISLGGSPANMLLRSAVDRATAAGTIIVFSAGNQGVTDPTAAANPDPLAQIANDPIARGLVIVAGSVDSTRALSDFSNRAGNTAPAYLTALGREVRSIDQTGRAFLYSGTSFAAPVVAGALALLAQAFPQLSAAQLVDLLYRSADDRGAAGIDAVFGRGEVNIARAFQPQGSTSLPGTAVAVSLTGNAMLSGAMGDAAKGGLGALVRDMYGRDFDVDLSGTVERTPLQRPLEGALAQGARHMQAARGRTSFALTIDDRLGAQPLMLSQRTAEASRVLAGAMALRVSKDLMLGIGAGRGADGLVPSERDRGTPAFLIGDRSLDRAPVGAFAMRQRIGGIGLTLSAEAGDMRLWERGLTGPRFDGYRRYAYSQVSAGIDAVRGPLTLTGRLTQMREDATILGGRFGAALGGSGATSWFADAGAGLAFGAWRLDAAYRRGWTRVGANSLRGGSTIESEAMSASLATTGLMHPDDTLGVRWSQPLRVSGGGLNLTLPGTSAQFLPLDPSGRERDWEAVYVRPLGKGWITGNVFLRQQPGHFATAPDDLGAAVRYSLNF